MNKEGFEVSQECVNADQLLKQLRASIQEYLSNHPNISLNGLSKKCNTSESTLRRIMGEKVKTLPNPNTVLDILITISKEESLPKLVKKFSGPLGSYLKNEFNILTDDTYNYRYCEKLNKVLKDPQAYLVFKLASNHEGVRRDKITQLLGLLGEQALDRLIREELLIEDSSQTIKTKIDKFTLDSNLFIDHFKLTSSFIKTQTSGHRRENLHYNFSESVSLEAYQEIMRVHHKAIKKVVAILNDKNNQGNIPVFTIGAVDTLDLKSLSQLLGSN